MNIVLFGAGHHAAYCIDILENAGEHRIVGLIDSIKEIGSGIFGYPIIGRQDQLVELIKKYEIDGGLITIGDNWGRKNISDFITNLVPHFRFINAIHPSTIIGKNVSLGVGIVTMAGVIINTNSLIADFCFLATGAQLEHDSIMKEFSSISAGSITGGRVIIGKYSAVTLGVIIIDRITIGENVIIGSGSLVMNDFPDNVLAYGSPAKIIRYRKEGEKFLKG